MEDGRYWSYVGEGVDETTRTRRAIRTFLEAQADRDASDLDSAELVAGELIANAVRHGAPPFGICIDWDDDPPILCVVDRGPGMRPVYPAPELFSESGRGLLIVRALAGEVVVDVSGEKGSGTRIVVALPVRRPPGIRAA